MIVSLPAAELPTDIILLRELSSLSKFFVDNLIFLLWRVGWIIGLSVPPKITCKTLPPFAVLNEIVCKSIFVT